MQAPQRLACAAVVAGDMSHGCQQLREQSLRHRRASRRRKIGHLLDIAVEAGVVLPGQLVGTELRQSEFADHRASTVGVEVGEVCRRQPLLGSLEHER